jgi:hypothetical protein
MKGLCLHLHAVDLRTAAVAGESEGGVYSSSVYIQHWGASRRGRGGVVVVEEDSVFKLRIRDPEREREEGGWRGGGGGGLNLEGLRYRSVSLVVCRRYPNVPTHRVESHFHAVPQFTFNSCCKS